MAKRDKQRFTVNGNRRDSTPQLSKEASQHWTHMGALQPN